MALIIVCVFTDAALGCKLNVMLRDIVSIDIAHVLFVQRLSRGKDHRQLASDGRPKQEAPTMYGTIGAHPEATSTNPAGRHTARMCHLDKVHPELESVVPLSWSSTGKPI